MARKLHYYRIDVFTNEHFGGNPLAVFTNGRGLSTETMQRIAKEMNLSESTFVLPPEDPANDWKVRIFTPGRELPMAGHPTIGTSFVLAREHMVTPTEAAPTIRLEEGVGLIPVTFSFHDGAVSLIQMQQPAPTFFPELTDRQLVADALSLTLDDLGNTPIQRVSCGVPFLFIPLKTMRAIKTLKLRMDIVERAELGQMFVFTGETTHPTSTAHARMFAPTFGIAEDPATGSACGPLGCYLVRYGIASGDNIICEQGFEMGRPSIIHIEIRKNGDDINFVGVGGESVYMGEGFLEV